MSGHYIHRSYCCILSQEREAAPDDPVIMNPFRHNIPATIKNAGDLPDLDSGDE